MVAVQRTQSPALQLQHLAQHPLLRRPLLLQSMQAAALGQHTSRWQLASARVVCRIRLRGQITVGEFPTTSQGNSTGLTRLPSERPR